MATLHGVSLAAQWISLKTEVLIGEKIGQKN